MESSLDYQCKLPHHEFEEMGVCLEKSKLENDVMVTLSIDNGLGYQGNKSRVHLTATELREVMFVVNRYIQAQGIMDQEGGQNGSA